MSSLLRSPTVMVLSEGSAEWCPLCAWCSFGRTAARQVSWGDHRYHARFGGHRGARRGHVLVRSTLPWHCTTLVVPHHFWPTCSCFCFEGNTKMAHRGPAALELIITGFSLDTAVPPLRPTRLPARLLCLAHAFPAASHLRF